MALITTETGKEFDSAQDALGFIRGCAETMLNPNVSHLESSSATIEMVYTFQALDYYLRRGGELPITWEHATRPSDPRV